MNNTEAFILTGNSGKQYSFFPRYNISDDNASKGEGIYVFMNNEQAITDIQYLSDDKEAEDTIKRLREDGAKYFYYKNGNNRLDGDADIDDIKTGEDYRNKID